MEIRSEQQQKKMVDNEIQFMFGFKNEIIIT